ncbi:MAG: NAD-dependent epimerase/dehydratase family protein, partial [Proteobacteria bacterium]|nr:NAD-dependent epimerase/dehydratase family protein [Pseudomonadota bacterium]
MKILVTGAAGFIGFHTSELLLGRGDEVVGLDNLNDYYDVGLKEARLARLNHHRGFRFHRLDLAIHHTVDHPLSLYAATKKANELMAHTYSHLYRLPTTGLRFFTVYGPWGRPDMAMFLFTKAILAGQPIDVFNHGKMRRDFTYIDDIVQGVVRTCDRVAPVNADWNGAAPDPGTSSAPYRLYNIGNHQPAELMQVIGCLEKAIGRTVEKRMLPMQAGDVPATYADVEDLTEAVGFKP